MAYIDSRTRIQLKNIEDESKTVWLDLPFSEDELNEALEEIGIVQDDEEESDDYDRLIAGDPIVKYDVADWKSNFLTAEHFANIFAASDLVERIENLDDSNGALIDALVEDGDSLEEALDEIEDGNIEFYPNRNLTELAQEFGEDHFFDEEYLLEHVDWESVGRDMGYDGYIEVNGGVMYRNR